MSELWYPANPTERAMGWALRLEEFGRFFRIFAAADLFVPIGTQPGDGFGGREFVTSQFRDRTCLPVFTSDDGLLDRVGDLDYVFVDYSWLAANWPRTDWLLAINPVLPIRALLPIDAVQRGQHGNIVPLVDPEVLIDSIGDNHWRPWRESPHQALLAAVSERNAEEYLDALLECQVTTPTSRELRDDELVLPLGNQFPWPQAGGPAAPVVEVFTSEQACVRAHPDPPRTTKLFRVLLDALPPGSGLSVNPGGPAGLDLPGEKVPLLVHLARMEPVRRRNDQGFIDLIDHMRWVSEAGPPEITVTGW